MEAIRRLFSKTLFVSWLFVGFVIVESFLLNAVERDLLYVLSGVLSRRFLSGRWYRDIEMALVSNYVYNRPDRAFGSFLKSVDVWGRLPINSRNHVSDLKSGVGSGTGCNAIDYHATYISR